MTSDLPAVSIAPTAELEAEEETFDPAVTDIRPIADNVEGPVTIERAFKLFLP